jgi:hypothetical protein
MTAKCSTSTEKPVTRSNSADKRQNENGATLALRVCRWDARHDDVRATVDEKPDSEWFARSALVLGRPPETLSPIRDILGDGRRHEPRVNENVAPSFGVASTQILPP